MPKIKFKCRNCGQESTTDEMERNKQDIPAYCPHCGRVEWEDMNQYGIFVAEQKAISEYMLNGDIMEYWSYFSGEGFRFIQYDMLTGEENREGLIPWHPFGQFPIPKFLFGEHGGLYNYNEG